MGSETSSGFLRQKLPAPSQVVFVTHSPAMIDSYNLEQVRQVEFEGKLGTKVGPLRVTEGNEFDLLEPVRSALGLSIASSLLFNELNVLVEGAADKPVLEAAFLLFYKDEKILVNGSIAEIRGLLPRLCQRGHLPYVLFLDADSGGRGLAKEATDNWGVPGDRIVPLDSIFKKLKGDSDYELEDILSEDFYFKAVQTAYPERDIPKLQDGDGKRTKLYTEHFKDKFQFGFSKKRVGESVKRLLLDDQADDHTLDNLKRIAGDIRECLRKQTEPAKDDSGA